MTPLAKRIANKRGVVEGGGGDKKGEKVGKHTKKYPKKKRESTYQNLY